MKCWQALSLASKGQLTTSTFPRMNAQMLCLRYEALGAHRRVVTAKRRTDQQQEEEDQELTLLRPKPFLCRDTHINDASIKLCSNPDYEMVSGFKD